MSEVARLAALARKDGRGVARDRFLLWMALYPPVLALATRLAAHLIPLEGIELWLAPTTVVLAPSLLGMLFGFALVEEREQDTLILLRVLPMRGRTVWVYWIGGGLAASLLLALVCTALYGRMPSRPGLFLAAAAVGAATGPTLTLILGALTSDKIQALAAGKMISAWSAVPLLMFVVAPAWHPLLWWSPWYWLYGALLRAFEQPGELARLGQPYLPAHADALWVGVPAVMVALLCAWAAHALSRRDP
jgi:fluoroquinolone transport system permease protein